MTKNDQFLGMLQEVKARYHERGARFSRWRTGEPQGGPVLRLEHRFYTIVVGWYEAKARIIRDAVRTYIDKVVHNPT